MIVALQPGAGEPQIQAAIAALLEAGFEVHRETGAERTVLACLGQLADALRLGFDPDALAALPGVAAVHRISAPYRLAARAARPGGTVVRAAGLVLGEGATAILAAGDPGAAAHLPGARALRGRPADPALRAACDRLGWAALVEVVSEADVPASGADLHQAAADLLRRNPRLVRALADAAKPVLVARAHAEPLDDLLLAADAVLAAGNPQVALLLPHTLELAALPRLQALTHLPLVVDLALAPGDLLEPMAAAARAAGAHGLVLRP